MTPIIIVIWLFSSFYPYTNMEERLSDTKGVIRSRQSNDRQYNGQKKMDERQTTIYKRLHSKLKIE
jgi:hypothetical protein